MLDVIFQGHRCTAGLSRYANGRPALLLYDARDGEEVAVASVNVPDAPAAADEVFIKDYSENEGMLAALEAAGVVRATGEHVESGFVSIPRARLAPGLLSRMSAEESAGADDRHGEAASNAAPDAAGVYQVWLNDNPAVERISSIFGAPPPAFPNGFLYIADVTAGSVNAAYFKAHAEGNMLDPKDESWKDWQKNEGVRVLVPDMRGADFGDVIVSPDGKVHQLINGGFREILRVPLRDLEYTAQREHVSAESADGTSPSALAADKRPARPELATGRTKGKKP